jgi:anti-sigma factor RsiW
MIHPYVDGELDLMKSLDVETHMRDCIRCAAAHRNVMALRSAIHENGTYFRAPADLERRIRSELSQPQVAARRVWMSGWMTAAAAVVVIACTIWFATHRLGDNPERLLASEVTSAHVRSLMAQHLWDVKSTDQHTVKPWFDGKLDFAPDVRDFKNESFPLEGARLDYLAGRPVAALVYRHDKHYLNLFIWPATGQPDRAEVEMTQQGYAVLHWVRGGMNYWTISDTSADTLRRFAGLVREASPAATEPIR